MDLSTLGAIITIIYLLGIFMLQWISDWYFNASKSPLLDYLHLCWVYLIYWFDEIHS